MLAAVVAAIHVIAAAAATPAAQAESKTIEIAPNVFSASLASTRCPSNPQHMPCSRLTLPAAASAPEYGKARLTCRARLCFCFAVPKINLGTCCGSSPDVGLRPWLKAGGTGIDTAWSCEPGNDHHPILSPGAF